MTNVITLHIGGYTETMDPLIGRPNTTLGIAPVNGLTGGTLTGNGADGWSFPPFSVATPITPLILIATTTEHEAGHMLGLVHIKDTPTGAFIEETHDDKTDYFGTSTVPPKTFANFPQVIDNNLFSGFTQNTSYILAENLGTKPGVDYGAPGTFDVLRNRTVSFALSFLERTHLYNEKHFPVYRSRKRRCSASPFFMSPTWMELLFC